MKKLIGLSLSIVLFSSILPAFAADGYYETYYRQLYQQPTVCVFEPTDINLSDTTWKYWYSESKKGIDEWENRLKSTSSKNWDVNLVEIPKEKLNFLNPLGCDLSIKFLDSSYFGPEANSFNGLYNPSTKSIEIIRNQMTYCGKYLWEPYGIFLDRYCRGDDLERGKKMAATVKHEFGHAFGLGHFVSDNRELMQSWYVNPLGAPSIMAAAPSNEDVRQITQLDIERVLEIHGPLGFGKEKNSEPVFIYPEKVIVEPTVSNVQNIQVKPYQTLTAKITGYIPEEIFSRGTPVEFKVTKPNGATDSFATIVNKHQYFEYPMSFDSKALSGTYEILVIYKGEFIQKNAINLSKITSSDTNQQATIPNTNTGSGKYLEKINVTSENNEYYVKAFFGKLNHPTSYIRITVENECPIKKQVFENDFVFRAGTEINFSFYQTTQGKPSQCSIYFSISDFNGNKLDHIKKDYTLQTTKTQSSQTTPQVIKKTSNIPVFTENQKQELLKKIDSTSVSILKLKEKMDSMWSNLNDAKNKHTNSQSKQHIEKAWKIYNKLYDQRYNSMSSLDSITSDYMRLEDKANTSAWDYFGEFSKKISKVNSDIDEINSQIKYITQELDYAEAQSKVISDSKQCFLFWCS